MIYRYLGNSGIKVSVLSYGNSKGSYNAETEQEIIECVKECFDHGVNFFDTAEIYGQGEAEKVLGKAIKELNVPRSELVISTKFGSCGRGINDRMLSRKHLTDAILASL